MNNQRRQPLGVMILGDLAVLILVTLFGFATHSELRTAGPRMLTTLIPLLAAWTMSAPVLGAYDWQLVSAPRNLWRPFYAMILAAPLAAWLRALMLGNVPILPIFVFVLAGVSSLAILTWRALHWLIFVRKHPDHG